jgi:hypothetical protein
LDGRGGIILASQLVCKLLLCQRYERSGSSIRLAPPWKISASFCMHMKKILYWLFGSIDWPASANLLPSVVVHRYHFGSVMMPIDVHFGSFVVHSPRHWTEHDRLQSRSQTLLTYSSSLSSNTTGGRYWDCCVSGRALTHNRER